MYAQTFKCIQPWYAQNRQKPAYVPVFPGYIPESSLQSVEHGPGGINQRVVNIKHNMGVAHYEPPSLAACSRDFATANRPFS